MYSPPEKSILMHGDFNWVPPSGDAEYAEARLRWRMRQGDEVIRALASDYIRGFIDESTYDAYQEYIYRWGDPKATPGKGLPNRSRKRRDRRSMNHARHL